MDNTDLHPLLVSVPDAARMIGLGKSKFYELAKAGDIRIVKLGGRSLISIDELRAFVAAKIADATRTAGGGGA